MNVRTRKTVVVVGCGFAGLAATRELARSAHRAVDIVVYDKQPCLYNYPVLPRLLNEHLPKDRVEVPLSVLFRHTAVDLRHQRIEAVDALRRVICTATGETPYDYLVLAPGSRAVPLAQDDGIFVFYPKALRHLHQLTERIAAIAADMPAGVDDRVEQPHRIAIVGGGLTGVEFAMAVREAADRECAAAGIVRHGISIGLYEAAGRLHPRGPRKLSQVLEHELTAYGIRVSLGRKVLRVSQHGLLTTSVTEPADTVVCCIGSRPNLTIELAGLDSETHGIPVDDTLRCRGQDGVFAVGDGMLFGTPGDPRLDLRLAHRATAQGRHVARNIGRLLCGQKPRHYRPRETPVGVMLQSQRGVFSYRGVCLTGILAGRAKRWLELRHT